MTRPALGASALVVGSVGVLQASFSVAAALPPWGVGLGWLGSVLGVLMVGCAYWIWRYGE